MTPSDMKAIAANLRRWRSTIRFPGDGFFLEDLSDAARALEEAADKLTQLPQGMGAGDAGEQNRE